MKTRILHTKFWKDNYVSELSPNEKLLFIYLLTNENINMCGVYELNLKEATLWTGLTVEDINTIKSKFQEDKKFVFHNQWVCVVNHSKFNNYGRGNKQKTAFEKELRTVPNELKEYIQNDTSIDTSIDTSSDTRHKSETIKHKPKRVSSLDKISENDFSSIANKYDVTTEQVKNKFEDLVLYCQKSGKKYEDYRAALMSFIRKDISSGKIKTKAGKLQAENPDIPNIAERIIRS